MQKIRRSARLSEHAVNGHLSSTAVDLIKFIRLRHTYHHNANSWGHFECLSDLYRDFIRTEGHPVSGPDMYFSGGKILIPSARANY